jgi:hypothetical protein
MVLVAVYFVVASVCGFLFCLAVKISKRICTGEELGVFLFQYLKWP